MNSIRLRLLLTLLITLAAAAALMGAVTYRSVLAETQALFDYQLRQMALSLRDQGAIAPAQARALADQQLDFVVQIWTVDGRSIYASRQHAELPTRAYLGFADVNTATRQWRTFSVAAADRVIQVAQPREIRERQAADAALRSVSPLLLMSPLMALAVWWLAAATLRPLQRVAADVRERDAASLEPLATTGLPDEVAPLVGALNALLQRLGQSLESQRAFVADAAHELRSPLTALKLQLQLLQRAGDDAARTAAAAALAEGVERATRLVEQLLTLARTEPGAAGSAAAETFDLAELARAAVADAVPLAQSRGSRIELHTGEVDDRAPPVPVHGEHAQIAMLVRNLVDNALRYSPPGAQVAVRVAADGAQGATLSVDDSGPGIPAAERERVFDRFYRRNTHDEPGTGLGLAIVRQVAQRHGARVSLGDSALGGLRVQVQFAPRPMARRAGEPAPPATSRES